MDDSRETSSDRRLPPEQVDRILRKLGRERSAQDYRLGRWLLEGFRQGVHRIHGYADFHEYSERVFGFNRRVTEERLRTAEALEDLPLLSQDFEKGAVLYSIARELTRVATAETEAEWMEATQNRSAREVQRLVSGRSKGDRPFDERRPEAERRRVSWDLSAEAHAKLREAQTALTRRCGHSLDDDSLVSLLAEAVLSGAGSRDEGRSAYQVALTVCERCGHAAQQTGGEPVTVDETTVAMAGCDGQHVGRVDDPSPGRATQTIPPRIRRAVLRRHHGRCAVPGCHNGAFVHVHHLELRSEGGAHDPERMLPLCSAHHRAVHDGRLVIAGTYAAGFAFTHADGSAYGAPAPDPGRSKVLEQVFQYLCAMGFRQREARQLLDQGSAHVGADDGVEQALRTVLRASSASTVRETLEPYGVDAPEPWLPWPRDGALPAQPYRPPSCSA